MPRALWGGLSMRSLFFTRWTAAMLPPYYTAGPARKAAAGLASPLRSLFWSCVTVGAGAARWSGCTGSGHAPDAARTARGPQKLLQRRFPATQGVLEPPVPLPRDIFYGAPQPRVRTQHGLLPTTLRPAWSCTSTAHSLHERTGWRRKALEDRFQLANARRTGLRGRAAPSRVRLAACAQAGKCWTTPPPSAWRTSACTAYGVGRPAALGPMQQTRQQRVPYVACSGPT
jgi:hypothetical protein